MVFFHFRQGLVELLERFTEEGISGGLQNVKRLERISATKELLEAHLTINNSDLVLVATNDTHSDRESDKLIAKAFIYPAGDDSYTPLIEIDFLEQGQGTYSCSMSWFTTSGQKPISGIRTITKDDCKQAGIDIAELVIGHFYRFTTIWVEKPTLGIMLQRQGKDRPFGFQSPRENELLPKTA